MTGFVWNARRDAALEEMMRAGEGSTAAAYRLRCTAKEAAGRWALLRRQARPGPPTEQVATVPRPLAPPPPPGKRRALIDLSRAPSSMEQAAKGWGKRNG